MGVQLQLEREGDSELFEDLERWLKRHPRLVRFLFNPAGFTFVFGWILAMGMLIGWMAILVIDASTARRMMAMFLAEFVLGREFSIPLGLYELGLPVLLVAGISFTHTMVTTTWFYPLFYTFRRRQRDRNSFWGYFFRKMEQDAERRKDFVEKYGALGLFFFMLIPFAINGPLIGAIIGKLVGIRTRYILPTVILATLTATAIWTAGWLFFEPQVSWFRDTFGGHWIFLGMVTLFLLVIGRSFVGFLKDVSAFRRVERHRMEIARRLKAGTVIQVLHAERREESAEPARPQTEPSDAA